MNGHLIFSFDIYAISMLYYLQFYGYEIANA